MGGGVLFVFSYWHGFFPHITAEDGIQLWIGNDPQAPSLIGRGGMHGVPTVQEDGGADPAD